MDKKENVYEMKKGAEQVMEIKEKTGEQDGLLREGSTIAGKFKDVNALVRAYESLQAEFTRRSQRLKELENTVENLGAKESASTGSGVEKLRKNAENRRARAKEFDEFVLSVEQTQDATGPDGLNESPVTPLADKVDEKVEEGANGQVRVERTAEMVGLQTEKSLEKAQEVRPSDAGRLPSDDDLYLQVCHDEGVRLRIIGEYLASVGRSAPPITATGVGTFVSPPRKARNIGDASSMALQYLKGATPTVN